MFNVSCFKRFRWLKRFELDFSTDRQILKEISPNFDSFPVSVSLQYVPQFLRWLTYLQNSWPREEELLCKYCRCPFSFSLKRINLVNTSCVFCLWVKALWEQSWHVNYSASMVGVVAFQNKAGCCKQPFHFLKFAFASTCKHQGLTSPLLSIADAL